LEDPVTSFNCECADTNDALTLAEYRRNLLIRCGFAAIADNPPPGTAELMDTFLRDAQNFLYLKYPALRTHRFFRWSLQQGERYYGMRLNDENWATEEATITVASPGVVTFASGAAPADGKQVFFTTTGALPTGLSQYTRYYVVNGAGATAQLALTADGTPIDTSGTQSGVHTANVQPGAACTFNFEPYANIDGAWLEDLNGTWLPLVAGIPPTFYTTVVQPSIPVRYEIRQCIEVFPAPNVDGYFMYIKGHFGLAAFTDDTDKPTIDGQLVYLWALANALDYYGKPAARGIAEQAREHLGSLVAGTHGSRRYVPGERPLNPAVLPIWTPYPGESF
jgi:hypothetical protein